jgi:hypothetical protein
LLGRSAKFSLAVGIGVVSLFTSAAPAIAHDRWVNNYAGAGHTVVEGAGHISVGHLTIGACDYRADGRGARAEYKTANGGRDHVGDGNGAADGCGSERSYDGSLIISFRVCMGTGTDDCTGWHLP